MLPAVNPGYTGAMQEVNFIDATRCPLCGQGNQCAQELARATGEIQPPCWCTQATFSADLLAQIPAAARNKSCICAACAQFSKPAK